MGTQYTSAPSCFYATRGPARHIRRRRGLRQPGHAPVLRIVRPHERAFEQEQAVANAFRAVALVAADACLHERIVHGPHQAEPRPRHALGERYRRVRDAKPVHATIDTHGAHRARLTDHGVSGLLRGDDAPPTDRDRREGQRLVEKVPPHPAAEAHVDVLVPQIGRPDAGRLGRSGSRVDEVHCVPGPRATSEGRDRERGGTDGRSNPGAGGASCFTGEREVASIHRVSPTMQIGIRISVRLWLRIWIRVRMPMRSRNRTQRGAGGPWAGRRAGGSCRASSAHPDPGPNALSPRE